MAGVKIEIAYSKIMSTPSLFQLALGSVVGAAKVSMAEGNTIVEVGNSAITYGTLTYDLIKNIKNAGGKVYNYKSYFTVDLEDFVPDGIRGSEITSTDLETGEPLVERVKWKDWIHPSLKPITINGETWVSGYSHSAGFKEKDEWLHHLDSDELILLMEKGSKIKNLIEFKELMNQ